MFCFMASPGVVNILYSFALKGCTAFLCPGDRKEYIFDEGANCSFACPGRSVLFPPLLGGALIKVTVPPLCFGAGGGRGQQWS